MTALRKGGLDILLHIALRDAALAPSSGKARQVGPEFSCHRSHTRGRVGLVGSRGRTMLEGRRVTQHLGRTSLIRFVLGGRIYFLNHWRLAGGC